MVEAMKIANREHEAGMPKGTPYIIGNEAAERFSYYGMRAILITFMTQYLMNQAGQPEFTRPQSVVWYHNFMTANYFFPIIGAVVADVFWGKYRTIITLSFVYCLGHLVLAMFESKMGLAMGLTLIAVGAGGIKPCVSAHVGDQFTEKNKNLIPKIYGWFYFSINFGSFFSTLLTPFLLKAYGPAIAFGLPGLLMLVATIIFWMGRHVFISVPPVGWKTYKRDVLSKDGLRAISNLSVIFLFIAVFWALYDQTGSSWVIQAKKMARDVDLGFIKFTVDEAQVQAVNPLLILIFVPLFSYIIYPFLEKFMRVTPLRKIATGFFLAGAAFATVAYAEKMLEQGHTVSILWQVGAFALITASEVLVSVTSLEFAYTQAPNSMKSLMTSFYLLAVSLGNQVTAIFTMLTQDSNGNATISGSSYFWFFTGLVIAAGIMFSIYSPFYKGKTYVQGSNY